ncbi:MAG: DUF6893 family small protein [Nocardioides sp.]
MRIVGIVTTVIAAVIALGGVVVGIRSIPDVRRYLKIREM